MGLEYQLTTAIDAVNEAGKIILDITRRWDLKVKYKVDGTPRTNADEASEIRIRDIILSAFPNNSFTGEEYDPVKGNDQDEWLCDPFDGTNGLINGEKTGSISLALSRNEKTVLTVIYNPFTSELFTAAEGIKPTLNHEPIPNYNRHDPKEAVYNFQIAPKRKDEVPKLFSIWEEGKIAKLISRGGSVAYNLAQVAEGSHSVFIGAARKKPNKWDLEGGIYLINSVGGKVTYNKDRNTLIASTNPIIHEKTLDMLSKVNFGENELR